MKWHHLKGGAGKQAGDTAGQILASSNLKSVDLLVRESIQNSLDAAITKPKVKIVIKEHLFEGEKKRNIIDKLKLIEIADRALFIEKNNPLKSLKSRQSYQDIANDDFSIPLRIIEISDFYTKGLNGHWKANLTDEHNKFRQFMWSFGASEKNKTGTELGSYGYGKEAFHSCSNIETALYYTKFDPTTDSEGHHSRLIGSSRLLSHTYEATDYNGFLYFGEDVSEDYPDFPTKPIINELADEFIKSLSLTPRNENETGLSAFVIDCFASINDIRDSIEKWWWPLWENPETRQEVEIELFDHNKEKIIASPDSQKYLFPYIKTYRNIKANISVDPINNLYQGNKVTSGKLSLRRDDIDDEKFSNKVAFIRDERLVISYHTAFNKTNSLKKSEKPVYGFGCFIPDSKYEPIFRDSEPPTHDEWSPTQPNLIKGAYGPDGGKFIENVITSIVRKSNDFISEIPESHNTKLDSNEFFTKMLAPLLVKSKGGSGKAPPITTPRILSMQQKSIVTLDSKDLNKHELQFQIKLIDDPNAQNFIGSDCRISIKLNVFGNDSASVTDNIPIDIFPDDEIKPIRLDKDHKEFILKMTEKGIKGLAVGTAYKDWSLGWAITAEILGQSNE